MDRSCYLRPFPDHWCNELTLGSPQIVRGLPAWTLTYVPYICLLRKLGTSLGAVKIKIEIDGPYGAPAPRFYDFEQTIIVGAGVGVTPFSGILTDLQAKEEQRISTKKWRPSPYQKAAESRRASQQLSRQSIELVSRSGNNKEEPCTPRSEISVLKPGGLELPC